MTSRLGGALLYRLANSVINRIISSQSCWRFGWPDYGDLTCDTAVLPCLRVIWLVDLTCKRHEREFCTRPFKVTELEKGRWSWISNCGEAFHTDSWLAEANPGHSDRDAILKALLPGPRTVVLFGPGKARMAVAGTGTGSATATPTKSVMW